MYHAYLRHGNVHVETAPINPQFFVHPSKMEAIEALRIWAVHQQDFTRETLGYDPAEVLGEALKKIENQPTRYLCEHDPDNHSVVVDEVLPIESHYDQAYDTLELAFSALEDSLLTKLQYTLAEAKSIAEAFRDVTSASLVMLSND